MITFYDTIFSLRQFPDLFYGFQHNGVDSLNFIPVSYTHLDVYKRQPFSTSELLARVRAMLRRKDNYTPDLLNVGELVLNRSTYEISCHEKTLPLSGREFQIMEILMQRPGFIVTIDEFMSHVWGLDSDVDISVVWVHISNIRKKLAAIKVPIEIRFVKGAGYLLEAAK